MFNSIAHCFSGFRVFFLLVYWNLYAFWKKIPLSLCIYMSQYLSIFCDSFFNPFYVS